MPPITELAHHTSTNCFIMQQKMGQAAKLFAQSQSIKTRAVMGLVVRNNYWGEPE